MHKTSFVAELGKLGVIFLCQGEAKSRFDTNFETSLHLGMFLKNAPPPPPPKKKLVNPIPSGCFFLLHTFFLKTKKFI